MMGLPPLRYNSTPPKADLPSPQEPPTTPFYSSGWSCYPPPRAVRRCLKSLFIHLEELLEQLAAELEEGVAYGEVGSPCPPLPPSYQATTLPTLCLQLRFSPPLSSIDWLEPLPLASADNPNELRLWQLVLPSAAAVHVFRWFLFNDETLRLRSDYDGGPWVGLYGSRQPGRIR
jgi:hypothetical protein